MPVLRTTPPPAIIALAMLWLSLVAVACSFDDSGLALNTRCARSSDCVIGECVNRACVDSDATTPADTDANPDSVTTPDAEPPCPAGQLIGCDGCILESQQPGAPCGADNCGRYSCNTAGGVQCVQPPRNACGGCDTLGGVPGTECDGACTELICDGENALVCRPATLNACGGCTELRGIPGTTCGTCDGEWVCEGADRVVCEQPVPNFCGGCGGPAGAIRNAVCACPGADTPDPSRFDCSGDTVVCADRADARYLGRRTDQDTSPPTRATDVMQTLGDVDLFNFRGDDENGQDPLIPIVELRHDGSGILRLCTAWEYTVGGPLTDAQCAPGTAAAIDGTNWCCASTGSAGVARVGLNNRQEASGRLDTQPGADNDSGILSIRVDVSTGPVDCTEFDLAVTL